MSDLDAWIKTYDFPAGQMLRASERVRGRVPELFERMRDERPADKKPFDKDRILAQLERAELRAREWVALEVRWDAEKAARRSQSQGRPEAVAADARLDNALGGFDGELRGKVRGNPPGSDTAVRAARVLQTVFPLGIGAIVQLALEDELARVRETLKLLDGPLDEDIAALGLTNTREYLRELTDALADALQREKGTPAITAAEVDAAEHRCQEAWLGVIGVILGQFETDEPHHLTARSFLLEPIAEQAAAIARDLKRKRKRTSASHDAAPAASPVPSEAPDDVLEPA